jgi:HNH endonuclease
MIERRIASAPVLRHCLIEPPPTILEAGVRLEEAVTLHLAGDRTGAAEAIIAADMSACREWADSLWGKGGPWTRPRLPDQPPSTPGIGPRQAPKALEAVVVARDGHCCRFCGIGVVRRETRATIRKEYPDALRWGAKVDEMHAGFMAMTASFDHVLPYSRGGATDLENVVLCCWPCNNGRANLTLAEVGLLDPRDRAPAPAPGWEAWDGLARFSLAS